MKEKISNDNIAQINPFDIVYKFPIGEDEAKDKFDETDTNNISEYLVAAINNTEISFVESQSLNLDSNVLSTVPGLKLDNNELLNGFWWIETDNKTDL